MDNKPTPKVDAKERVKVSVFLPSRVYVRATTRAKQQRISLTQFISDLVAAALSSRAA